MNQSQWKFQTLLYTLWRLCEEILKNSFESFHRYTKKRKKSKFWMKLHLYRWWENGLVFKIARTKIHQNFLASKYDIKQHSDMTCGFLIQLVFCKICRYVLYAFSAVLIILLASQNPSSYSLLKFVYDNTPETSL